MQRVERVADLVRDTRGQQSQRFDPFALDRLKSLLPRLRGVVDDQHQAGAFAIAAQRRGVKPDKPLPWIKHLELLPQDARAAGLLALHQPRPVEFRQVATDVFTFGLARLQADQVRDRLVEVENFSRLIDHQHAVLDRVEQSLEKAPLARQSLDDGLQALLVEPANAAQHAIQKAALGGAHEKRRAGRGFKTTSSA